MSCLCPCPRGVDAVALALQRPRLCPGCWYPEIPGGSVGPSGIVGSFQDTERDSPESAAAACTPGWATSPASRVGTGPVGENWPVGRWSSRSGWDELLWPSLRRGGVCQSLVGRASGGTAGGEKGFIFTCLVRFLQ